MDHFSHRDMFKRSSFCSPNENPSLRCLLSHLPPSPEHSHRAPKQRSGFLSLSSQIISCGGQRGWYMSDLGSMDFPFKCLIFLFCASFQSAPCKLGHNIMFRLAMAVVGHYKTQGRCKESFMVKDENYVL